MPNPTKRDLATARRAILEMLERRDARGVVEGMSPQSLWKYGDGSFCGCHEGDLGDFWPEARDALAETIAAAIAAEREACADVAAEWADSQDRVALLKEHDHLYCSAMEHTGAAQVGRAIAESIRARGGGGSQ